MIMLLLHSKQVIIRYIIPLCVTCTCIHGLHVHVFTTHSLCTAVLLPVLGSVFLIGESISLNGWS